MKNGEIVFNNNTDKINDEALLLCNKRSNLEKGDVLFSRNILLEKLFALMRHLLIGI